MRAVLLDRDGVINRDSPSYIRTVDDWEPLPGSLEAIVALRAAGYPVAVCTNQAGIARGLIRPADLAAIHDQLRRQLEAMGGGLDGIFHCPHGPDDGCECRKPAPGLLLSACAQLGVPPEQAVFIGDSARDLTAGRRAGARVLLVRTGNGQATLDAGEATDVAVYDDLAAAARALINEPGESPSS